MPDEVVSSKQNAHVVAAAKLHRRKARREAGLSLLEGPHLLEAALIGGAAVERVFAVAGDDSTRERAAGSGVPLTLVTHDVLARVAATEHPRGPVAVIRIPRTRPGAGRDRIVLWGIGDPGNAGTIIRTGAAFAFDVAGVAGTVDLWSPKVLRAAAGAHFLTAVFEQRDAGVASLRRDGLTVVAAVPRGGVEPADLATSQPIALLVGEEAAGLPEEVISAADLGVTIPMPGGTESLNAAAAAAIIASARSSRR